MQTLDHTQRVSRSSPPDHAAAHADGHQRPARRPRWRFQPRHWWRGVPLAGRVIVVFVALVLVGNGALDRFGGQLAQASDSWGALGQIAACEHQSMTPDIIILGSSHAQAGIAPPILDSEVATRLDRPIITCNLGITTSAPIQDYYVLRRLIADGVRPKFLIYVPSDYAFNSPVAEQNGPLLQNLEYVAGLSDLPDIASTIVSHQQINGVPWPVDFVEGHLFRPFADRLGLQLLLCQRTPAFGPCPAISPPPDHPVASPATPLRVYPLDKAQGWYPLPEATATSLLNSQYQ